MEDNLVGRHYDRAGRCMCFSRSTVANVVFDFSCSIHSCIAWTGRAISLYGIRVGFTTTVFGLLIVIYTGMSIHVSYDRVHNSRFYMFGIMGVLDFTLILHYIRYTANGFMVSLSRFGIWHIFQFCIFYFPLCDESVVITRPGRMASDGL